MKRWRWLMWMLGLVVGLAVLIGIGLGERQWRGSSDLRLGMVNDGGLELIAFSPARRMINKVKVSGEVELWLPGGMGWYRADRLLKLLKQENKREMLSEVFFYNFGFMPKKIILTDNFSLFGELGWWGWLKWEVMSGQMLSNEQTVGLPFPEAETGLDEIMPRDMADNQTLNESVRVMILNTSDVDGLANFVARRLEWTGLAVGGVNNSEEIVDGCLIKENILGFSVVVDELTKLLGCKREKTTELESDWVELYLGRDLAQMIDYSSYVRTF